MGRGKTRPLPIFIDHYEQIPPMSVVQKVSDRSRRRYEHTVSYVHLYLRWLWQEIQLCIRLWRSREAGSPSKGEGWVVLWSSFSPKTFRIARNAMRFSAG